MKKKEKQSIYFRVDFGSVVGLGHLMRCINIGKEIKKLILIDIKFIVEQYSDDGLRILSDKGFEVFFLKKTLDEKHKKVKELYEIDDAKDTLAFLDTDDLLIVDHYKLNHTWEEFLLEKGQKVCAIDDINRKHKVNLLLDYSFWKTRDSHYLDSHVKNHRLIGSNYLLLRNSIKMLRKLEQNFDKPKLLISFGGGDEDNLSLQILRLLDHINFTKISILQISSSQNTKALNRFIRDKENMILYSELTDIIKLYQESDVCIGGGGVSSIERCFLGIPSLVVTQAFNQKEMIKNLYNNNLVEILDVSKSSKDIKIKIAKFLNNKDKLISISERGKSFFNEHGTLEVAKKIVGLLHA